MSPSYTLSKPSTKNQKSGPTSDDNSSHDELSDSGAISSDSEDVARHVAALQGYSLWREEVDAAKQRDAVSNDVMGTFAYIKIYVPGEKTGKRSTKAAKKG